MKVKSSTSNPLTEKRLKYQALIAQVNYLRSPGRSDGPSCYEAEDAAALEKEAEGISEELFYSLYVNRI